MTDEKILRRLLWLRHGCPFSALYGADGEMQCSSCDIDFKRMPPDVIEARWIQQDLTALAAVSQNPIPGKEPPHES